MIWSRIIPFYKAYTTLTDVNDLKWNFPSKTKQFALVGFQIAGYYENAGVRGKLDFQVTIKTHKTATNWVYGDGPASDLVNEFLLSENWTGILPIPPSSRGLDLNIVASGYTAAIGETYDIRASAVCVNLSDLKLPANI